MPQSWEYRKDNRWHYNEVAVFNGRQERNVLNGHKGKYNTDKHCNCEYISKTGNDNVHGETPI